MIMQFPPVLACMTLYELAHVRRMEHHFECISPLGLMNNNTLLDLFPDSAEKLCFICLFGLAPLLSFFYQLASLSGPHTPGEIRYEIP